MYIQIYIQNLCNLQFRHHWIENTHFGPKHSLILNLSAFFSELKKSKWVIFMDIGYDSALHGYMKTIKLAHKAICGYFVSNCLVHVFYFRCINFFNIITKSYYNFAYYEPV